MKTTAFLAIIFLVLSFTAANALAATNSFTRIFYYREGPRARESLLTYPSSIDVLAPRLDFPIFDRQKYNSGVYLRFRSNLLYQKFLKKSTRSVPPLLANARHPAKNFFSHFLIWRAIYFSSKRKKTFLWCFALNEQAAGLASFFAWAWYNGV